MDAYARIHARLFLHVRRLLTEGAQTYELAIMHTRCMLAFVCAYAKQKKRHACIRVFFFLVQTRRLHTAFVLKLLVYKALSY